MSSPRKFSNPEPKQKIEVNSGCCRKGDQRDVWDSERSLGYRTYRRKMCLCVVAVYCTYSSLSGPKITYPSQKVYAILLLHVQYIHEGSLSHVTLDDICVCNDNFLRTRKKFVLSRFIGMKGRKFSSSFMYSRIVFVLQWIPRLYTRNKSQLA